MQTGYTGHVTSYEWRWVIVVGCLLIVVAFTPFLWVVMSGIANTRWEFMGALHDYQNSAAHISRIFQGAEGRWVTRFLNTPEPHQGALVGFVYAVIGQVSRIIMLPPVVMFHIARVAASLFMYMTFYQLAANIWTKIRTRRLFFGMLVAGTGVGWLVGTLATDVTYLDLTTPEAFPFFSSLVNVHYPLALGCLALALSILLPVFRPGVSSKPDVYNGGGVIVLLSLVLMFVYPLALAPLAVALVAYTLFYSFKQKHLVVREAYWLLWTIAPALLLVVYYVAVYLYDPIVSEVMRQQNTARPPLPWVLVLSLGLPLAVALPGIYRAVRRFEPDGDQLMLLWLAAMLMLIYLPSTAQRRFSIGLMIPIAYFATRALEDFWFRYIPRRWRFRALAAFVPIIAAGHIVNLFVPTQPIVADNLRETSGMLLERDYSSAFSWLRQRIRVTDVVLAAPTTSIWIPALTGARVVYGHPTETLDAVTKRRAVSAWYDTDDPDVCGPLLQGHYSVEGRYTVDYVIFGPQEAALGSTVCLERLNEVAAFGTVRIYTVIDTVSSPDP